GKSPFANRPLPVWPFGWSLNDEFCALNTTGSSTSDIGPHAAATPPCNDVVTPRPAHTAPSLLPHGNALLKPTLAASGRTEKGCALSDLNIQLLCHGCAPLIFDKESTSGAENGRSPHAPNGTFPSVCR